MSDETLGPGLGQLPNQARDKDRTAIGSASFFETYGDARRYAREGAECLETIPETPVRGLMADLIAYTVNRGGVAQQG